MNSTEPTKTILAPQAGRADSSAQVLNIQVGADEEVRWQWTHYPDGTSAVTGYEIVKKDKKEQ